MLPLNHPVISFHQTLPSFLFIKAPGRVFLINQRNSSDPRGLAGAEHACAVNDARLATAEELRHAVLECSFSACTQGWLEGGSVGTTVCSHMGGALKAVDVNIGNATEDNTQLDIFCVKDKGVPCGDPPAFPNTQLQRQTGFEIGEELLYACLPGHVMPSGQSAFSLMCDSCGEWYGLVQLCVKDKTEAHIDYEDKFTDDHLPYNTNTGEEPVEGRDEEVYEQTAFVHEVKGAGEEENRDQGQLEVETEEEAHGDVEPQAEVWGGVLTGEEGAVEDSTDHLLKEDKTAVPEATEVPVSLLSQKHLFWFPSEAFQEVEDVEAPHTPITVNTPPEVDSRVSGSQSEESKEDSQPEDTNDYDSHEVHSQQPVDPKDDDDQTNPDRRESSEEVLEGEDHVVKQPDNADHDTYDSEEAHRGDQGQHEEDGIDNYDREEAHREDRGQHREEDHEKDDREEAGQDDSDDGQNQHEDDDRIHHHNHGEHEDHDTDDVTDQHDDLNPSTHHKDHYEVEHQDGHDDHSENDRDDLNHHDPDDHDDHDDNDDHNDHDDRGHNSNGKRVVPPAVMTTSDPRTVTQAVAGEGVVASTDETWLDGYPISQEETNTKKVGVISTIEGVDPQAQEEDGLVVVGATDSPNDVESSRPSTRRAVPVDKNKDHGWVGRLSPTPSSLFPESTPLDSHSADYATPSVTSSQGNAARPASTDPWETPDHVQPFLEHHPAPTVWTDDVNDEDEHVEWPNRTRPGEERQGEEGEREGEKGETGCSGGSEDCPPPPPPSHGRGPTVAAIVIAVCAVAVATAVGAWCYRQKQQKSSMYEMNGKGQSLSRHGQQIEMQQKV
ncbi:hypothetical protein DPEC_G00286100 [Dallia pectoralis]|uniref:Uncharacterized protein n=1 Tax=Dallia pectoralis TaxID=75939 RepID=A0ACC2FK02_DALPE|nr:hypothetical protein DPEC_G00286100 [Dallia pectoralis]